MTQRAGSSDELANHDQSSPMPFIVNLGGEGEESGALNQQPGTRFSRDRQVVRNPDRTFGDQVDSGHDFLLCLNTCVSLPDGCADCILTNGVPVYPHNETVSQTFLGPVVMQSEIARLLKSDGVWLDNGDPVDPSHLPSVPPPEREAP